MTGGGGEVGVNMVRSDAPFLAQAGSHEETTQLADEKDAGSPPHKAEHANKNNTELQTWKHCAPAEDRRHDHRTYQESSKKIYSRHRHCEVW